MIPLLLLMLTFGDAPKQTVESSSTVHAAVKKEPSATLDFSEMYTVTPRELKPTDKLLSLNGRQVRLIGFMAELEEIPNKGSFFLCSLPCQCDEGGAGTADLPPQAIRVILAYAPKRVIPHVRGRLILNGRLEVGNQADEQGVVSHVRLVLDKAPSPPKTPSRPPRSKKSLKK